MLLLKNWLKICGISIGTIIGISVLMLMARTMESYLGDIGASIIIFLVATFVFAIFAE